jgi:molecular chaperone HtpG
MAQERLGFQAEVQQLLHLMVHSLYSNREIFLRELISNASDAADKLRFESLAEPTLLGEDPELAIWVEADTDAGTITVRDNGIGMSRDDVVANLGTIARSGTAEFLRSLSGDARKDAKLIGQFGVGFYSSFVVAEHVEVRSRKAGLAAADGVLWSSDGQGEYTVEPLELPRRGTEVTLHLRADDRGLADPSRLRALIHKYSDHIGFPVRMRQAGSGDDGDAEFETVNAATALWTLPRQEIEDEEYTEFYRHISHDMGAPLCWSHNRVEGKREYTSLLYVPARAPFDLWNRESPRGIKLYIQRVFIMDDAEQFLPRYLRFVRGVVDCADLPLNISRELLQRDPTVEAMRSALTRRVLGMLEQLAANEAEKYREFWREFGQVLKEGPIEEPEQAQKIAPLIRFATTRSESFEEDQSLADYVGRMAPGQEAIYYVVADTKAAARSSPHLEGFTKRGIEVILLSDRIDDLLMAHLAEYDGKALKDVSRGGAGPELAAEEPEGGASEIAPELLERVARVLGEKVAAVRATRRLTESPACLVVDEHAPSAHLRRLMAAAGQDLPAMPAALELNPEHPLIRELAADADEQRFSDLVVLLYEQAGLAEGTLPDDPAAFVKRLNRLLVASSGQPRIWTPG